MGSTKSQIIKIEIIEKVKKGDKILELVTINFSPISRHKRNVLLDQLINEQNADYFIEFWDKGGIMMKPRTKVYGVFGYEKPIIK